MSDRPQLLKLVFDIISKLFTSEEWIILPVNSSKNTRISFGRLGITIHPCRLNTPVKNVRDFLICCSIRERDGECFSFEILFDSIESNCVRELEIIKRRFGDGMMRAFAYKSNQPRRSFSTDYSYIRYRVNN